MFRESPPNTPEKVPDTVPFTHIILHQSTIPRNILPGIRRIVKDKQPAGRGRTKDRLRPQGRQSKTASCHPRYGLFQCLTPLFGISSAVPVCEMCRSDTTLPADFVRLVRSPFSRQECSPAAPGWERWDHPRGRGCHTRFDCRSCLSKLIRVCHAHLSAEIRIRPLLPLGGRPLPTRE